MTTILVVDDEPKIAAIATDYLRHAGYRVITAGDGPGALDLVRSEQPALVVLDLKLPGMDGLDVTKKLRAESDMPIIMLTARVEESDRLRGLALGADDYITKPFSPREFVARVKTVLRRVTGASDGVVIMRLRDLTIDGARQVVTRAGKRIELTVTEIRLLTALARQPGRVFTRTALLDAIRGAEVDALERAVDAYIKNLRRKIEIDPRNPKYVLTVYGLGYKAVEP